MSDYKPLINRRGNKRISFAYLAYDGLRETKRNIGVLASEKKVSVLHLLHSITRWLLSQRWRGQSSLHSFVETRSFLPWMLRSDSSLSAFDTAEWRHLGQSTLRSWPRHCRPRRPRVVSGRGSTTTPPWWSSRAARATPNLQTETRRMTGRLHCDLKASISPAAGPPNSLPITASNTNT